MFHASGLLRHIKCSLVFLTFLDHRLGDPLFAPLQLPYDYLCPDLSASKDHSLAIASRVVLLSPISPAAQPAVKHGRRDSPAGCYRWSPSARLPTRSRPPRSAPSPGRWRAPTATPSPSRWSSGWPRSAGPAGPPMTACCCWGTTRNLVQVGSRFYFLEDHTGAFLLSHAFIFGRITPEHSCWVTLLFFQDHPVWMF